jgi:hypothetical protein
MRGGPSLYSSVLSNVNFVFGCTVLFVVWCIRTSSASIASLLMVTGERRGDITARETGFSSISITMKHVPREQY